MDDAGHADLRHTCYNPGARARTARSFTALPTGLVLPEVPLNHSRRSQAQGSIPDSAEIGETLTAMLKMESRRKW